MTYTNLAGDASVPHGILLTHARASATRGFATFPLKPGGKTPAFNGWQEKTSTDPARIGLIWDVGPTYNVGVATGQPSGLVVIDLDRKNGKDGVKALDEYLAVKGVELPATLTVETPTGGLHRYYRYSDCIRNGTNIAGMAGVDVRGDGGYVVGAGSVLADGRCYTYLNPGADIAELPPVLVELLTKGKDHPPPAPRLNRDSTPADLLLAYDPFVQHCRNNAATISYGEWFALGSNLALVEGGHELFHELSALDPSRYNTAEADKLLQDAAKADKPCTVAYIEDVLGFQGYRRWPLRGTVKAPVDLKNAGPVLLALQNRYVLDTGINHYHDLADRSDMKPETINNRHAHKFDKGKPHEILIRNRFTPKVDRSDYRPDVPELVFQDGDSLILNRHVAGGVEACEGDCGILLDHFAHLLPNEPEREHVLNVLAHMVQQPASKVRHVVLLTGPQGTGKSFIGRLAKVLAGASNVFAVENEHLHAKWRRLWGNRQMVVFEELMAPGKLELANSLKVLITEERMTVEDKNIPLHAVRTPRIVLAFSNHADPMCLEATDRRWFVAETAIEVPDRAYFDRLWSEGLAQAGAFKAFLLRRDLSAFSAAAPPPETAAKAAMKRMSRTPLAQELQAALDEEAVPPAVVTADQLRNALIVRWVSVPGGYSNNKVAKALRDIGYVQYLTNVRLPEVKHPTKPWLSPEAAGRLLHATPAEVVEEYRMGLLGHKSCRMAA